jgi:processive 1,2-diacylglycerol beta-glucosyltransferase
MRKLYDAESNQFIGAVSDEECQLLVDELEEESLDDVDYYVNRATLDLLAQEGAGAHLLTLLQHALGDREDMEVRWVRDTEE